jgi:hypothetical protein
MLNSGDGVVETLGQPGLSLVAGDSLGLEAVAERSKLFVNHGALALGGTLPLAVEGLDLVAERGQGTLSGKALSVDLLSETESVVAETLEHRRMLLETRNLLVLEGGLQRSNLTQGIS